jgi:GNAT superfamily N-acetyltransferase
MISIRQYEPSDYDACRNRLWVQLTERHREIYNAPDIGGDDPGADFDKHLGMVGPERLWVAEVDGTVVGLTGLIVGDEESEIEAVSEIEPLVVDREHRGQGIGTALISYLKKYVPARDLPELVVKPAARNERMLKFMSKQGFDTIGIVELILRDESSPTNWAFGAEVSGLRFKV